MTEQEAVELIQKAGSEWQRTRGDMKSYLRTVIRLTEEKVRADYETSKKENGLQQDHA